MDGIKDKKTYVMGADIARRRGFHTTLIVIDLSNKLVVDSDRFKNDPWGGTT